MAIEVKDPETAEKEVLVGGPDQPQPGLPNDQPPTPQPEQGEVPIPTPTAEPTPGAAAGTPAPATETPTPQYRFKTWEEAEKAEVEAKRRMHEATRKAADLEKQLREAQVLRDTRSDEEYQAASSREMAERLAAIPTDDPQRMTKELALMGEYTRKTAERIVQRVMETQRETLQKDLDGQARRQAKHDAALTAIRARLTKEGLTHPRHERLFLALLDDVVAMEPEFEQMGEEAQFARVLTPLREMLGLTTEQLAEVAKANAAAKAGAQPMGRGGRTPTGPAAAPAPKTLSEQLREGRRGVKVGG